MTKTRVLILLSTLLVVGIFGYFAILLARGYRFDIKTLKFNPNGIIVIKSDPTGAQIFVDGNLKGATDSNISLAPGTYDVNIKKEGYLPWYKRLTVEKEIVTVANLSLFKPTPALVPITFSGATSPVMSNDFSRIAFAVIPNGTSEKDKIGLWVMDTNPLPLGFNRDAKRITDGDLTGAAWYFSPNSRDILLKTSTGVFLLDAGSFTPQNQRINIISKFSSVTASWEKEKEIKLEAQTRNLPSRLQEILKRSTSAFTFSPDENKILYSASSSGTLQSNLIPQLPGSSTQKEERDIKIDHTYVYDIKEDRNFLVDDGASPLSIAGGDNGGAKRRMFWLSNSHNLVLAEEGKVTVMDYDGTNRQPVYSGSFSTPYVFSYINSSKLLILTNLGASSIPNFYSLNIK